MNSIRKKLLTICMLGVAWSMHAQEKKSFTVNVSQAKGSISAQMWGVFFEDINLGADGGIYAELIKNRSFEFDEPFMGWKKLGKTIGEGTFLVLNRKGSPNNPRYLRINTRLSSEKVGLQNEGFRGMGIKQGLRYDFSVLYRQVEPGVKLQVQLVDTLGSVIAKQTFTPEKTGMDWQKQQISFQASKTVPKAQLQLWFEGEGELDLDMISLFPEDTWKNRPGGLRADMVQLLADMKPGFIRFPGGCIVEGRDLANRFQWKKTVGPVEERKLIINRWNTEFDTRLTPDYYQSFGLGFFEYFQLAADLGAEPLPILNCGMACQFNTAELVPMDELDEYVQDALDLVEFANGDSNTKWGKLRTEMGHPEPFHLKMIGVGNENWGPQYVERLEAFKKALHAKYPSIQIVASSGTGPEGERFEYLDQALRRLKVDFIDEHYYRNPEWFLTNASRYDSYDRQGPKIFAGEYAAHTTGTGGTGNRNNWKAALAEAAFLTGLERNADVIGMASYAPLFAHVDGWQWSPDLIWVDNLQAYGTPSYHVQKLYATNKGNQIIPIRLQNDVPSGQEGIYASAVLDEKTNEVIIKVVNHNDHHIDGHFQIQGTSVLAKEVEHILLAAGLDEENTIGEPNKVSPQQAGATLKGKVLQADLPAHSFHVFKIKVKGGR